MDQRTQQPLQAEQALPEQPSQPGGARPAWRRSLQGMHSILRLTYFVGCFFSAFFVLQAGVPFLKGQHDAGDLRILRFALGMLAMSSISAVAIELVMRGIYRLLDARARCLTDKE